MSAQNISNTTLGYLARLGHAMRRHQRSVSIVQWCLVSLYVLLLVVPLFFSAPHPDDGILTHPRLFSQFLFWGIGWPLIFLSMMLFGRVWCGLFCPDGTVTEYISRHGRKQSIPRWIRWSGWPCTMLIVATVYGQLVGVYDLHWGTLLLLGLPTLGATWCGYAYGNGKRIWCMYLCPANGSFSLLAKIAPLHFHVDEKKWKQHPPPLPRIDCPTLIDIRHMKSNSPCHMCGRCAGYLNAVELDSRSPSREILTAPSNPLRTAEAATLVFGLLGVCTMAIRWRESNLFVMLNSALNHSALAALDQYTAPWWILANHPADNHVFSLLDGLSIVLYIFGGGILFGLLLLTFLTLATRIAAIPSLSWQKLSLALTPVGGIGIFLGLASFTVSLLRREGLDLTWAPIVQHGLLLGSSFFSLWLGAKLLTSQRSLRQYCALLCFATAVVLIVSVWVEKLSA
ncbi:MAG: 4Fe-4S binding protein [Oxalobacter sp.]|nr:MAG: 4Fe-4S binding protein [Oxalobacter sp.]